MRITSAIILEQSERLTNKIYIAVSLDGFIAEVDGGLDWLTQIPNPNESDFGFGDFMKSVDAVVMGRNTFEKVVEIGEWIYSRPVFVLSNNLISVPGGLHGKIELLNGNIIDVVTQLNARGYENLYVDGGKIIQEFLKQDLIDEMFITHVSIILGKGIPLFGNVGTKRSFKLVTAEILNDFLIKQHYKRRTQPTPPNEEMCPQENVLPIIPKHMPESKN